MPIATIITADVVNSTLLEKKQRTELFKSISKMVKPYKHDFYRGDSFQVFIKDNHTALELCLKLRLLGKKQNKNRKSDLDIRIAVGIGEVKSPLRDIRQATDEPFILSGRMLDSMDHSTGRLRIITAAEDSNAILEVISRFTDYIFKDITSRQAEVLLELLQGNKQKEVAKKLKKSQVTISRQAHAAGWSEIEFILDHYKNIISKYIAK